MEVTTDKYSIVYNSATAKVVCTGSLLLNGIKEYEPILKVLNTAAEEQQPDRLVVDMSGLKFLNSSGINMMTKFVIGVSDIKTLTFTLTVVCDKKVAWQEKLSKNLRRLMPTLIVESE